MAARRSPGSRWWGAVFVLLLTTGCGSKLAEYHLHVESLVPPRATAARAAVKLTLRCPQQVAERSVSWGDAKSELQWKVSHGKLEARLNPAVARLGDIERLREELDDEVAAGCLTADNKATFLRQLVEGQPLNSGLAQEIVLGPYGSEDYIDMGGPVALYLAYPLAPAHPGDYSHGLVEQTVNFVAAGADGKGRLQAESPHAVAAAMPDHLPAPPLEITEAGPPYLVRLFLIVRCGVPGQCGGPDHNAELLTAETHAELVQASARLAQDPAACTHLDIAGASCQPVPLYVQLEARVKVQVNGREVAVPLPATVAMAIETNSPGRLRVYRNYRGRLIEVAPEGGTAALMGLKLIGGEWITKQHDISIEQ